MVDWLDTCPVQSDVKPVLSGSTVTGDTAVTQTSRRQDLRRPVRRAVGQGAARRPGLVDGGAGRRRVHEIGKKIVEEAAEVWMAAEYQSKDEAAEEISQLLYHLQVMMLALDLDAWTIFTPTCENGQPRMSAVTSPGSSPLLKVAVPNKGSLSRAGGRDAARGRVRAAHRPQGTGAGRRGQRGRVLLPAAARHRRLRGRGHPRRRHHRPRHAARLRRPGDRGDAAGLRPQPVPVRRPRRAAR